MSDSTAESADTLEMPCLGRTFQLGMLYDSRNDRIIPGKTLWGPEVLEKVDTKPQETSDFEVIAEDSLSEKAFRLNVEASLKLSFLSGLVKVGGSAKYLDDKKSSKNQARVSLRYKTTSSFEQLNMTQLGNFEYPSIFDEDIATHVVTGVLYGADAFFVFDREVSKEEKYLDIHGNMEVKIKELPGIGEISGSVALDIKNIDKTEVEKFHCSFYGDVKLPNNPTTFQEAVRAYKQLPTLLGGGDRSKNVPKKVWLYPLGKLDSRAQRIVCEISSEMVSGVEKLMETLHEFDMQCNDLIKNEVCSELQGLEEKLHTMKRLIANYKVMLVKSLATVLPQIRGGDAEEAKLAGIIEENFQSPFSHKNLSSWFRGIGREVRQLAGNLQSLQKLEVGFAFKPGDLENAIDEFDKVLCFDFNVSGREDSFLPKMQVYLHTKKTSIGQDSSSKPWYETPHLKEALRTQLHLFRDFVEANTCQTSVKFVVTDGESDLGAEHPGEVGVISLYQNSISAEFQLPDQPGKPQVTDVTHESVHLIWAKPKHGHNSISAYSISYSSSSNPKEVTVSSPREDLTITGLTPETIYTFQVKACTAAGFSKVSEVSDEVKTKPAPGTRPAMLMCHDCEVLEKTEGDLTIYRLPKHNTMKKGDLVKCTVGQPLPRGHALPKQKVLMIVGATGAGKSTLINGFANYVMGVEFSDPFRFKLVFDEKQGSQANSQTKSITAYTFQRMEGSPLKYALTIIDTPGFGDTEGLDRDKYLTKLIKEFFSIQGRQGIDQLHGIGFVAQASLARLTPTQKYIFDAILSIFGKDIGSNIFLMTTFADGETPPLLDAVKAADVPFQDYYKFNNSALFADKSSKFVEMFWTMGKESFEIFFQKFSKVTVRSLQLTRQVLDEREQLELAIQGLQGQIHAGLTKMDQRKQEKQLLQHSEADIIKHKDFTYQMIETRQNLIPVPDGVYVTNCLKCNFTCHDNCVYDNDGDKYKCSAMSHNRGTRDACCGVCPAQCSWKEHRNTPYRIELYEVTVIKTVDDIKERYQCALDSKAQVEAVINQMEDELHDLNVVILSKIRQAKHSIRRLEEIALKPNPLSDVQYIELLIESEQQQKKPGFLRRIQGLQRVKQQAEMLDKVKNQEIDEFLFSPKQGKATKSTGKMAAISERLSSWWQSIVGK